MPVFLCAVRCARSSRSRLIYKRQWGTALSPLCSGSATASSWAAWVCLVSHESRHLDDTRHVSVSCGETCLVWLYTVRRWQDDTSPRSDIKGHTYPYWYV